LIVSSVPLQAGKDAAYWIAQLDEQNTAFCNETSNRHSITVDGAQFRQEDQFCGQSAHVIEVLGASDSRFYEFDFIRDRSDGSPVTATERAIFDRFLASLRFGD
jgi:phage baseplate assembly protein gpV